MTRHFLIQNLLLLMLTFDLQAQSTAHHNLENALKRITDTTGAKIGIGVLGLDFEAEITVNGNNKFPMQSVYKLPLAMAVLQRVDGGDLRITQELIVKKENLDMDTWSPFAKEISGQERKTTITELLKYTVSKSDNNTCDLLFDIAGSPRTVQAYIDSLHISGIKITSTEKEMKANPGLQYDNYSTPHAMLQLLQKLYLNSNGMMSAESHAYLMKLMTESDNAPNRIKGLLPQDAVVAHKTGTSGTDAKGIRAALNDVAIIILPDGRHYALVVFVSNDKAAYETGERRIADISKLVWNALQKK